MLRASSLLLAAVIPALLAVGACRSPLDVCEDGCGAGGVAGSRMNPVAEDAGSGRANGGRDSSGGTGGNRAGDGGSHAGTHGGTRTSGGHSGEAHGGDCSGAPGSSCPGVCSAAADCDDGFVCNGSERCEAGTCVPGASPACEHGTTCSEEHPAEPCGYATVSPWLVLFSLERIYALPTAEIGQRELLLVGEREGSGIFVGFNALHFSPDGRRALIDLLVPDFGQQVLELSFGRGLPSALRAVDELPNWGEYSWPIFAPNSSAALISDGGTGAYWLDLSKERAVPTRIDDSLHFSSSDEQFCDDSTTWVTASLSTSTAKRYSLVDGKPLGTLLSAEGSSLSPDASRIFLHGAEARFIGCASDLGGEPLGVAAESGTWSPSSRSILVRLTDGSAKLYGVSESMAATELWSGGPVEEAWWSPNGGVLVLQLADDESSNYTALVVAAEAATFVPFQLPEMASLAHCGDEGCLAFVDRPDDGGRDLVFQSFGSMGAPRQITADPTSDLEVSWTDLHRGWLLVQRANAGGGELAWIDFSEREALEQRLFEWEGHSLEVVAAPDATGFVVRFLNGVEYANYWIPLPRNGEAGSPIAFGVPAYQAVFQPWE